MSGFSPPFTITNAISAGLTVGRSGAAIHSVLVARLAQYQFVHTHPFLDGNQAHLAAAFDSVRLPRRLRL